MKNIFLLLVVLMTCPAFAQRHHAFNPDYHFLTSRNLTGDKNFYLLTVIGHTPVVKKLLMSDNVLAKIYQSRSGLIKAHVTDSCNWPGSLLAGFRYSAEDSLLITNELAHLYDADKTVFNTLIEDHLRPSGYYQLFASDDDKTLLLRAFAQVVRGSNYIIDQFGLGEKLRYPLIDSATYYVNGSAFRSKIKEMFAFLAGEKGDGLFFDPSRLVTLKLMEINGRDEPARNEPLQKGINKAAYQKIKGTQWNRYPNSSILILGAGPDNYTDSISHMGKLRCDTAVIRFKKGLAPFIIVSGGYVAPFRTHYCEAMEMKKYLMRQYGVPESSIIVDPFARHTTTNIRNANRLIFRYGIPASKPVLTISTTWHIGSITDSGHSFDNRNMRELGYLPYIRMERKGPSEAVYSPGIISLHMDPGDPLDP